jgi:hypothetical protein
MKYSLFVGSSVEGLKYARALQQNLRYEASVTVWPQGIFRPSNYPLDDLLSTVGKHDFGAFIFLPEDILILRGQRQAVVRDNVLFELGLFFGRLGRQRAFLLKPRGEEMHLPSDLAGLTPAEFDLDENNPQAGIGAASTDILAQMERTGVRPATAAPSSLEAQRYDREAALLNAVATAERKPLVRCRQYMRIDAIKPSGDVAIIERFNDVVAISDEPVRELPVTFSSRSGRPANWRCESMTPAQEVRWEWRVQDATRAEGAFIFNPPVGKAQPVSFRTERHVFNGVTFTRTERLDATNGKDAEESARFALRHVYDAVSLQITFPETRFPARFRVTAWEKGQPADRESAFANEGLTAWPETRNVTLTLPKPLPGVKYEINWELPDEAPPQFTTSQLGFTEEMSRRLLGLRVVPVRVDSVTHALRAVREQIVKLINGQDEDGLFVALYVYDRQKAGLSCVATLNADRMEANWQNHLYKPGRHIVGIAFRNRAINAYTRPTSTTELDAYELAPGEEPSEQPQAAISIPLFYAGRRERSLAVLCVASTSPTTQLAGLSTRPQVITQLETAFTDWYEHVLAGAVGVIPTAQFWGCGACSS